MSVSPTPGLTHSWGCGKCAEIEWGHTFVMDSGVGSASLPIPTAYKAPQDFMSPGGKGHGLLQSLVTLFSKHQYPLGLAEGLLGDRGVDWRGSKHPDVNSMQTGARSVLLVVVAVAVPVIGSST